MGVYIKDMEMPKSCDDCRIMMLTDTNCVSELYCGCPIVFQAHPQGVGYRPVYCPLVPAADVRPVVTCINCLYNNACLTQAFVEEASRAPFDRNTFFCADGKREES